MSDGARRAVSAFLADRYPGSRLRPIAGDASTRRFFRLLASGGSTRVVMDYGSPFENETDDCRLERLFRSAGLPAARIEAVSPEAGCLVLEDLGERTLESFLSSGARPEERERLYREAVDLAVAIAVRGTEALRRSERAAGPALDADRFVFEMDFFLEHYVGRLLGRDGAGLRTALASLAERAADGPRVLCHRDYHARNLMVRDDGSLAMVDIQDARWGPVGYDLVSLVFDAYVDVADDLVGRAVARYRRGVAGLLDERFEERLAVVGAQRMIKALGTFGHQIAVRGRDRYRDAARRTVARLERFLPASPAVAELAGPLRSAGVLGPGA